MEKKSPENGHNNNNKSGEKVEKDDFASLEVMGVPRETEKNDNLNENDASSDNNKVDISRSERETDSVNVTNDTDNLNVPDASVNVSRSSSASSLSFSPHDELIRSGYSGEEASNEDSEAVEEIHVISRSLPPKNVPEKIIFCVDLAEDPNYTPFKLGDGSKYSPLFMIRRVIEIFMHSKNIINKAHEFALLILHTDTVTWLRDFTNKPHEIMSVLDDMSEVQQNEMFDFSALFDVIKEHVTLPKVSHPADIPPPYIVRAILIYTRSFCIPKFTCGHDSYNYLISSDYFMLDTLYVHEDPSDKNNCEEIFNILYDLDGRGFAYIMEVPRNATKLHDCMAKLLAHPLQRPTQKVANYKLKC